MVNFLDTHSLDAYADWYVSDPPIRIILVTQRVEEDILCSINISARFKEVPDIEKLASCLVEMETEQELC